MKLPLGSNACLTCPLWKLAPYAMLPDLAWANSMALLIDVVLTLSTQVYAQKNNPASFYGNEEHAIEPTTVKSTKRATLWFRENVCA